LRSSYEPVFRDQPVDLYVARQWDERSEIEEEELLSHPVVKGLVYSSEIGGYSYRADVMGVDDIQVVIKERGDTSLDCRALMHIMTRARGGL
jgi:hypothetical protein